VAKVPVNTVPAPPVRAAPPVPGAPPPPPGGIRPAPRPPGAPKPPGVPGAPGAGMPQRIPPRQPQIKLASSVKFGQKINWKRVCFDKEDQVLNRICTQLNKDWNTAPNGQRIEVIWRNDIKMNPNINPEWCLEYYKKTGGSAAGPVI
jgi:hypothetical protein